MVDRDLRGLGLDQWWRTVVSMAYDAENFGPRPTMMSMVDCHWRGLQQGQLWPVWPGMTLVAVSTA